MQIFTLATRIGTLCGLAALIPATGAVAEAVRPSPNTVIATVRPAMASGLMAKSAQLAETPHEPTLAAAVIGGHLTQYRATGEARHLSYAVKALEPWADATNPPTEILLMRAIVRQTGHAFESALADLGQVIEHEPDNVQALLSRSFIYQALGRLADAAEDCRRAPLHRAPLAITTCRARINSLSGHAERADRELTWWLNTDPGSAAAIRRWALTNHAEIALRRGDPAAAEQRFREALDLDGRDTYLRLAYADLLIDQGRATEVIRLLDGLADTTGRLLRLALAKNALGAPDAGTVTDRVEAAIAMEERDGTGAHDREAARFWLTLGGQPGRALELALVNWKTQREPEDARLVLGAALAAGSPGAASAVLEWLSATGLQDARLAPMVTALAEERS